MQSYKELTALRIKTGGRNQSFAKLGQGSSFMETLTIAKVVNYGRTIQKGHRVYLTETESDVNDYTSNYWEKAFYTNVQVDNLPVKPRGNLIAQPYFYDIGGYNYLNSTGLATFLSNKAIEALGTPIELPYMPFSFKYSKHMSIDQMTFVGRRNKFSTIGSSFKELIENSGPRKVIQVKNYDKVRNFWKPEVDIQLNTLSGKEAAKPGNWFLYSQKIPIFNPFYKTEPVYVNYVGLASCMSYNYFTRCKSFFKMFALLNQAVENLESIKVYTPFSRYPNQHDQVKWTKRSWKKYSKMKTSDLESSEPEFFFMSAINQLKSQSSTPLGLKYEKVLHTYKALDQQLQDLEDSLALRVSKLQDSKDNIQIINSYMNNCTEENYNAELMAKKVTDLSYFQSEVPRLEERIANVKAEIESITPKHENLKRSVEVLKVKLDKEKESLVIDSSSNEYEQNLAKEGFVVDDIFYRNAMNRDEMVSIKDNPQVLKDKMFKMCSVEMHTTKPIEIIFGNSQKQKKISGPHRIVVNKSRGGYVQATISTYAPWAASYESHGSRKFYPHTPEMQIPSRESAAKAFEGITNLKADVCLGELAATASMGFRENDPTFVVMAVKSFLQSVNATDVWGKTYTQFPDVGSEMKPISFAEWKRSKTTSFEAIPNRYNIWFVESGKKCFIYCVETLINPNNPSRLAKMLIDNGLIEKPDREYYLENFVVKAEVLDYDNLTLKIKPIKLKRGLSYHNRQAFSSPSRRDRTLGLQIRSNGTNPLTQHVTLENGKMVYLRRNKPVEFIQY